MKRLLIFVLTWLATCATAYAGTPYYCASVAGSWPWNNSAQGGSGPAFFQPTQDYSTGDITGGQVYNWYCHDPNNPNNSGYITSIPITSGSSGAEGAFTFYLDTRSFPSCIPPSVTITIPLGSPGCQNGSIVAGSYGEQQSQAQACIVPNAINETTFKQWDSAGLGHWQEYLGPATINGYGLGAGKNFAGRTITSTVSNKVSNCDPDFSYYNNGNIYIDSSNTINEDLGWTATAPVESIRNSLDPTVPCASSYTETMEIDCANPSGPQPFESFQNTYAINGPLVNGNTVSLVRYTGTAAPIVYVYPHGVPSIPQNEPLGRPWLLLPAGVTFQALIGVAGFVFFRH